MANVPSFHRSRSPPALNAIRYVQNFNFFTKKKTPKNYLFNDSLLLLYTEATPSIRSIEITNLILPCPNSAEESPVLELTRANSPYIQFHVLEFLFRRLLLFLINFHSKMR